MTADRGPFAAVGDEVIHRPVCKSATVLAPTTICGSPATVPITVACVHEHIRDGYACAEHAPDIGSHYCGYCYEADGHKCRLTVLLPSNEREHAHG